MLIALLSALAGWIAALVVVVVAAACASVQLIRLYAGEAALPALFKLLREGCISVSGVRLAPTPRAGPVSLRLPASLGGHTLFSADQIVASEKLWRILLFAKFDVAVHGCELDAGIDEGTLVPHFGRLLLWSGLASMPEEEAGGGEEEDDFEAELLRRTRRRATRTTTSGSGGGSGSGSGAKRRSSSPSSSSPSDSSSSSSSESDSEQEGISSFVEEEASAVAAAAEAAAAAATATAAAPASPSSSVVSFPPPISVPFTARLRCGPATVHIGRGKLRILEAAAEVLVGKREEEGKKEKEKKNVGENDERENAAAAAAATTTSSDGVVSVVFAAGAAALRREALALDLSESSSSSALRWADECSAPLPREQPGAADGRGVRNQGGRGRRKGRQRRTTAPVPLCRPLLPFALRLEARHGGVQASGWWTTTGFLLREPARAAFDLTPALVVGVLSRVNPLLAGAVKLREDDAVRVTLWPLSSDIGGHLPASSVRISMRPLRLQMEPNALVAGSLRLVSGYNRAARALGGGGGGGTKKKESAAPLSASSSTFSLSRRSAPAAAPPSTFASFLGKLTGRSRSSSSGGGGKNSSSPKKQPKLHSQEPALEAWTSSLSATLHGGGKGSKGFWVDSGRLDMLISKSGFAASGAKAPGTAHVAAWGTASLLPETSAAVRAREKGRLARERARAKERKREEKRKRKKERKEMREKKEKEKRSAAAGGGKDDGEGSSSSSASSDNDDEEERGGEEAARNDDGDDDDPATSGLRMTLALMSDCLGLPDSDATDAPWPAVRVAVTGTALEPRIGWLGATRDAAALLLPGRRRRTKRGGAGSAGLADFPGAATGGSGGSGGSGGGGGSGGLLKSSSGFFSSSSHRLPLPWEGQLQRSGGSRREETAGAPLGPRVVGRLERSGARSKSFFSGKRRSSGSSGGGGGGGSSSSSLRIRGGGGGSASS